MRCHGETLRPLQIMIGVDSREMIAFHVLVHSIMSRASRPVSIVPVFLPNIEDIFTRKRDSRQSTEFTYSRFLTPYLSGYDRVSIFMDGDMLCLADICELEDLALENIHDVMVVKHDYIPKTHSKFLGQKQTTYPCKNWSSLMVFNGARQPVRNLTPEYINTASPMDLHQFKWAKSVGELPSDWNHLVGEYEPKKAKIAHFTLGIPAFKGYEHCEYSREWFNEFEDMTHYESMQTPRLVGA